MMEPKRLFEEPGSELERALLDAGRKYDHVERRRVASLLAVGVGTAAAAGHKTGWAMLATWKKVVVGTVIASTGVGGAVVYQSLSSPSEEAVDQSTPMVSIINKPVDTISIDRESTETLPEANANDQRLEAAAEPLVARETPASEPEPTTRKAANRHSASKLAKNKPSIRDEVAILDRARAAVSAGNGSSALHQLDGYAAEFPKGSLRLEAEVLRIQALAAAGRKQEASQRAKRLLSRSPNSVVASRLRRYVVE